MWRRGPKPTSTDLLAAREPRIVEILGLLAWQLRHFYQASQKEKLQAIFFERNGD